MGSLADPNQGLNPWHSQEGQALFESRHGVSWKDMQVGSVRFSQAQFFPLYFEASSYISVLV